MRYEPQAPDAYDIEQGDEGEIDGEQGRGLLGAVVLEPRETGGGEGGHKGEHISGDRGRGAQLQLLGSEGQKDCLACK